MTGAAIVAMRDVAAILRSDLGDAAGRVPTRRIPDLVVRAAARFDPEMRTVAADLGFIKRIDVTRMRTALGITPRPAREAVVAAGETLVRKALVRAR